MGRVTVGRVEDLLSLISTLQHISSKRRFPVPLPGLLGLTVSSSTRVRQAVRVRELKLRRHLTIRINSNQARPQKR